MSATLAEFIEARLAEDEAAARATEHADGPQSLHWRPGGGRNLRFNNGRSEDYHCVFAGDWDRILVARNGGAVTAHIARHDPARVLREVEAKRAIVNGAGLTLYRDLCLRALAAVWSDHPAYRPEWAPS